MFEVRVADQGDVGRVLAEVRGRQVAGAARLREVAGVAAGGPAEVGVEVEVHLRHLPGGEHGRALEEDLVVEDDRVVEPLAADVVRVGIAGDGRHKSGCEGGRGRASARCCPCGHARIIGGEGYSCVNSRFAHFGPKAASTALFASSRRSAEGVALRRRVSEVAAGP